MGSCHCRVGRLHEPRPHLAAGAFQAALLSSMAALIGKAMPPWLRWSPEAAGTDEARGG
jgi:hypothetical protein